MKVSDLSKIEIKKKLSSVYKENKNKRPRGKFRIPTGRTIVPKNGWKTK